MRRLIILFLALSAAFSVSAQPIRTNYRSAGITHISTQHESFTLAGNPAELRVEKVSFPGEGGSLYVLYLNLLQKNAVAAPKGVKMAITLSSGRILRLEQIGEDSPTKPRLENGLFVNRLKYAVEPADMAKMCENGVKNVDIITGWSPEDYLQASFHANELGVLLQHHCSAIEAAKEKTVECTAALSGYTENLNSILSSAQPIMARGEKMDYNVLLSHLYYKNNNTEDLDLALVIGTEGKYHIPYDAPVHFILEDGSEIGLLQTRDDVNFVYVYPTLEDLFRITQVGVKGIRIDHEEGSLEDSFPLQEDSALSLSEAINQQLQLLLSLSPR